jgi:hypothetical protein
VSGLPIIHPPIERKPLVVDHLADVAKAGSMKLGYAAFMPIAAGFFLREGITQHAG